MISTVPRQVAVECRKAETVFRTARKAAFAFLRDSQIHMTRSLHGLRPFLSKIASLVTVTTLPLAGEAV